MQIFPGMTCQEKNLDMGKESVYNAPSVKEKRLTGGLQMEDGRLMRSMLLDFYGELLTQRQRQCFDLHYNEDLSLSEIAEQCGVSRQGVWDNIRRAEAAMQAVEEKTGLVARFLEQQRLLSRLRDQALRLRDQTQGPARATAEELLRGIDALIGG